MITISTVFYAKAFPRKYNAAPKPFHIEVSRASLLAAKDALQRELDQRLHGSIDFVNPLLSGEGDALRCHPICLQMIGTFETAEVKLFGTAFFWLALSLRV